MKRIIKTTKKGFTLLEMIIVVAILVILAGISFVNVTDSIHKAKNRQSSEESKFVTQVQSQADYCRRSILSKTPRLSV